MPTLLSRKTTQVVMTTTCSATSDNIIAIMTTVSFRLYNYTWNKPISQILECDGQVDLT